MCCSSVCIVMFIPIEENIKLASVSQVLVNKLHEAEAMNLDCSGPLSQAFHDVPENGF